MSKAKNKPVLFATDVLDVLAAKRFAAPEYAFLREVSDGTGWAGGNQRADGLVVSCWPSRGIWIGGVEVKVARSDWRNELKNPAKSSKIQKWCSYWWVATPPGVVEPGEMPETWGHLLVEGKTLTVVKEAPKLEAEPPTLTFFASVLRNASSNQAISLDRERVRGRQEAEAELGTENFDKLKADIEEATRKMRRAESRLENLEETIKDFEKRTGMTLDGWQGRQSLESYRAAQALAGFDLGRMETVLRHAADQLTRARAEIEAAKEAGRAAE